MVQEPWFCLQQESWPYRYVLVFLSEGKKEKVKLTTCIRWSHMEERFTSPPIFNLAIRGGGVVSCMHCLLCLWWMCAHGNELSSVYIILYVLWTCLCQIDTFMYFSKVFHLLYLGLMQQHWCLCWLHIGYSIPAFTYYLGLECRIFKSCLNFKGTCKYAL